MDPPISPSKETDLLLRVHLLPEFRTLSTAVVMVPITSLKVNPWGEENERTPLVTK
jgi:hypothetical protein